MFEIHIYGEKSKPIDITAKNIIWHDIRECCLCADFVWADYPLIQLRYDNKLVYSQSFKTFKNLFDILHTTMIKYIYE